jgi:hypothetical protein
MALINKNREPSSGELQIFGLSLTVFGLLMGGLVVHWTSSWTIALVIWSVALLLCTFYYAVSAAQHMIYHTWMAVVYPIGWLISHALIAMVFYLVITPIGLVIQLCGRDPLQRKLDRSAKTYWTPHNTRVATKRYFQQF